MRLTLPAVASLPAGVAIPSAWVRVQGYRAVIAGQGALNADGSPAGPIGQVPTEVSLEDAQHSAELAVLANIKAVLVELPTKNDSAFCLAPPIITHIISCPCCYDGDGRPDYVVQSEVRTSMPGKDAAASTRARAFTCGTKPCDRNLKACRWFGSVRGSCKNCECLANVLNTRILTERPDSPILRLT